MLKVVKREKAHFRIEIYDMRRHKSKTVSVLNHAGLSVDDIKEMIIHCIENQKKSI